MRTMERNPGPTNDYKGKAAMTIFIYGGIGKIQLACCSSPGYIVKNRGYRDTRTLSKAEKERKN